MTVNNDLTLNDRGVVDVYFNNDAILKPVGSVCGEKKIKRVGMEVAPSTCREM